MARVIPMMNAPIPLRSSTRMEGREKCIYWFNLELLLRGYVAVPLSNFTDTNSTFHIQCSIMSHKTASGPHAGQLSLRYLHDLIYLVCNSCINLHNLHSVISPSRHLWFGIFRYTNVCIWYRLHLPWWFVHHFLGFHKTITTTTTTTTTRWPGHFNL